MSVTIDRRPGGIAVVTIDNPPVNALSQAVRQSLFDAAVALDADREVRGVVLACAGRTFIAGADISEFGKPSQPPHLPDTIARIEQAEKPWLAAIHGTALGGGLEVALGCRWRMATKTAKLGLPEVTLGIIPGAGGTVRLPRLVAIAEAVEMVTSGRPVSAAKAQAIGLIDAVAETDDLLALAIAFLAEALAQPLPQPLADRSPASEGAAFWTTQEAAIAKRARGEVAPLKALVSLRNATEQNFADAMAFERATFLDLRGSDQAAALRHVFFAERAAPKPPEYDGVEPRPIRRAAVIGGGTMGAGIAAALRDAGLPVVLIERDQPALERGLANLRSIFDGGVKRGRLTTEAAAARMAGVEAATNYTSLADADLVIEAVFEDVAVKKAVFAAISEACRPNAVLATNTSYLDPNAIAEVVIHRERFIGLHFFSPANIMKLLEIVPAATTSRETVATGLQLARLLGKIPVIAGVCDGFIGNRILKNNRPLLERLVLSGIAPQEIDTAMRRFGQAMGPFEVGDLAGLDIAAMQRKAARERGETPFAPIADRLVEAGRLGQKTGGGWYDYAPGERGGKPSAVVAEIIADEARKNPTDRVEAYDLAELVVFPMVDEAARILAEGIARRPTDIDLVQIHGYGFPRWRGGLMHFAERRGLADIVATLRAMSDAGLVAPPSDYLVAAAERGRWAD
jgi:3-hydroxyacyl-CoA dehydrogenase